MMKWPMLVSDCVGCVLVLHQASALCSAQTHLASRLFLEGGFEASNHVAFTGTEVSWMS